MKNTTLFDGLIFIMNQHCNRMDGRGLFITFSPVTNSFQSYNTDLKPRVLASRADVEFWVNQGSSRGPVQLFFPCYLSWQFSCRRCLLITEQRFTKSNNHCFLQKSNTMESAVNTVTSDQCPRAQPAVVHTEAQAAGQVELKQFTVKYQAFNNQCV